MLRPIKEKKARWHGLLRGGATGKRKARPNLFYPIFFSILDGSFHSIGVALDINEPKENIVIPDNCFMVLPISSNNEEATWEIQPNTFKEKLTKGYIKFGPWKDGQKRRSISHLQEGMMVAVEKGEVEVFGKDKEGTLILGNSYKPVTPLTTWVQPSHSAGDMGSTLLKKFISTRAFAFPKSLYAVHDAIRFFVANKPNALIVDFFAGSGTTLHAVNLLNAEDGGSRRCIMVTNNEVGEKEANDMRKRGLRPGDEEWEKLGIARYVNWPRTVCSIKGVDVNGQPIKGNYIGSDRPMADGFEANCEFFKLEFLDKREIALGRAFREIFPLLWLKAGAKGIRLEINVEEELPAMYVLPENNFAVLVNEDYFPVFLDMVNEHPEIEHVFIVTDSNKGFQEMALELSDRTTYQLYRDYLDNFRINFKDFNSK